MLSRIEFLKRTLGGGLAALLPWQKEILDRDFLLEDFEEAGIEEEFQRRENAFWLDRMILERWEAGLDTDAAILDPGAFHAVLGRAPSASLNSSAGGSASLQRLGEPTMTHVYVSDFGTLRLLHARDFSWVELNEHGAWVGEVPKIHQYPKRTYCYSGGPLNGQTREVPTLGAVRSEVPIMDERGRIRRVSYLLDRREQAGGEELYIMKQRAAEGTDE